MKCYHGTTKKGLKAILSGENHKPNSPWNCSDQDGVTYVWPLDKTVECEGCDGECDGHERAVVKAFESAQVQAAIAGDTELYVIVLDIDDDMLSDDYSADNMSDAASCINTQDFKATRIITTYHCSFNRWHAPFVIKGLLQNCYFNTCAVDEDLLKVAEQLSEDVWIDEIYEFDYKEYY